MAVHGFATQAWRNRRLTWLFLLLYGGSFFAFTLLILSPLPVLYGQTDRSLFIDPLQYFLDYWPVALAAPILAFTWNRYTFALELRELLAIKPVTASDERRFAGIAEIQATMQGLRMPALGIVETPALNALTLGAIGVKPMVVVTRGLLDALDDDELAAVFAHEIAHWRLGDTGLLTVNQVLMRTAIALQAFNPLKPERNPHHKIQWHFVFGVLWPFFLILLFVGGLLTMTMWRLARFANRKIRTGRDLIADGEAVRATHFPEALESAIAKCGGQGWFENAERFEALLFEGATVAEGGTHPEHGERVEMLRRHAGSLYAAGRVRGDTRSAAIASPASRPTAGFGRRGLAGAALGTGFAAANATRPEAEEWTMARGLTFWTDPDAHRKWRRRELDLFTWRAEDKRDLFGVARDFRLTAYGALTLSLIGSIAVTSSLADYLSHVSGRTYLLQADDYFLDFQCTLTSTVQECEKEREVRIAHSG